MRLLSRLMAAITLSLTLAGSLSWQAHAAEKLTVYLDWFVNPDHAPLVIAKTQGYFAEAGLEVELIAPSDPSAPPRLIAAGQGDIAISYQPQLHVQVAEGLPLTRIGTIVETPLNSLVMLKDGPIKTIADLKGKKVGYSVGGFEDALLAAMLKQEGLSLDDVELININFSLSPSLITGAVDAVIGAFRNFELNQLDIEKRPGIAFYPEENGVPVYDELIFIAKSDRANDPRFRPFMDAVEKATLYLTTHSDDALAQFLKEYPDLDNELNRRAWGDTLPRFAKRPAALDTNRYERFAKFMKDADLIKEVAPLESYAVELD